MARGNKYICRVCGKTYDYCPACAIIPNSILEDGFCSAEHFEIFSILSKHGCKLATAEETLEALEGYDLEGLTASIERHIKSLYDEHVAEEKEAE